MTRLVPALGALLLLLAAPAAAQDQGGLDRARDLADQVMAAMGMDVWADNMPEIFADGAARSLVACTPSTPPEDVREMQTLMRQELAEAAPRYVERIRDSYARRLSIPELEALVAFYATPEGKRIAQAAADLRYDEFMAQIEIDSAAQTAYERMGWCDNAL